MLKNFDKLYNEIVSEMKESSKKNIIKEDCIEYYAAFTDDGKEINRDNDLFDLVSNCTMSINHVNKFKVYKVNELSQPKEYKLIETYVFNDETNKWEVISDDEEE